MKLRNRYNQTLLWQKAPWKGMYRFGPALPFSRKKALAKETDYPVFRLALGELVGTRR
jgi:hypothetical protein